MNLDLQTFGLPGDVYAIRRDYVVTARGRIPSAGFQWHGVLAEWKFDDKQIRNFRRDPTYAWLDLAFATKDSDRTELQRRVVTALRFSSLATAMVDAPIRVALWALALEALLRDDLGREGRRHRIARRVGYLTCGRSNRWALDSDANTHRWPDRPACFYLEAHTVKQRDREMRRLKEADIPNVCSWYWHAWDVFEDRDDVMHEARSEFDSGALSWHQINLDIATLSVSRWAAETGAADIEELDKEIDAFVSKGVLRTDSSQVLRPRWSRAAKG
jgi:hypothetical protein